MSFLSIFTRNNSGNLLRFLLVALMLLQSASLSFTSAQSSGDGLSGAVGTLVVEEDAPLQGEDGEATPTEEPVIGAPYDREQDVEGQDVDALILEEQLNTADIEDIVDQLTITRAPSMRHNGVIDFSLINSAHVADPDMTYCSLIARMNLENFFPTFETSKEIINNETIALGNAISLMEQNNFTGISDPLAYFTAVSDEVFDVYLYKPYNGGIALDDVVVHDLENDLYKNYLHQGHRVIVFRGENELLYVLDPLKGNQGIAPQLLSSYLNSDDLVGWTWYDGQTYDILETEETTTIRYGIVDTNDFGFLNVRSTPNVESSPVGQLLVGDKVEVLDESNGRYKIRMFDGSEGRFSGVYMVIQEDIVTVTEVLTEEITEEVIEEDNQEDDIEEDNNVLVVTNASQLAAYAIEGKIDVIMNDAGYPVKAQFLKDFLFQSEGGVNAHLKDQNSVRTIDNKVFDASSLGLDDASISDLAGIPMTNLKGSTKFGIPGQHLVFDFPVRLDIPVAGLDGDILEIMVHHDGDDGFGNQGLTLNPEATCTDGVSSDESNKVIVTNGMVTIYTCGASTFAVGSSNTPATCGDSSVDAQETCDDGNNVSGDGCQGNEGDTEGCELEAGYACAVDATSDGICDTAGSGSVVLSIVPCSVGTGNENSSACDNGASCLNNGDTDCASGYCDVTGGNICADTPSVFACPSAMADIRFGIDESGSVDNSEFDDGLDFMYQVSDAFNYDALSGMQGGAFARWTTTVDHLIPVTEDFGDPDDSGLIQYGNIVVDNDGTGVRELYPNRQGAGGTDLTLATQHMADLINAGNGRRMGVPQVAVIITDALESQLMINASGGGTNRVSAANALRSAGPDGANIVVVLIAEAATSYTGGNSASIIDDVVGPGGLLITVPTYAEAADPLNGYIDSLINAICNQSCDINDVTLDCDQDGLLNNVDPNPNAPLAVDDGVFDVDFHGSTVQIVANDDFIASGSALSLSDTGDGDALGVVTFDATTGTMTYVAHPSEENSTVTVEYEVCFVAAGGCGTAVVTMNIGSSCDPLDPLSDCDEDGNVNGTDPHPAVPTALNDTGSAIPGVEKTLPILLNDDFMTGTGTSITDTGSGTAVGTTTFDPLTGELFYTPTVAEAGNTVTVIYEVCHTDPNPSVCDTAVVTIDVENFPVVEDDDVLIRPTDTDVTFAFDDNDSDLDDNIDLSAVTIMTPPSSGTVIDNGDGTFTYTPGPGFTGSDSFVYELCDDTDLCDTATVAIELDTDGDGWADIDDIDDDNDGIIDTLEQLTATNNGDTDDDGIPDHLDTDSDDDGITDLIESGTNPNLDTNNDGVLDDTDDTNDDGLVNAADPVNGGVASPIPDTDEDGAPDFQDVDSDDDSVLDEIEGVINPVTNELLDTDDDGTYDYLDTDDDDDTVPTIIDECYLAFGGIPSGCPARGGNAILSENTVYRCTDTKDNDKDGTIDCDDSDCQGLVVCEGEHNAPEEEPVVEEPVIEEEPVLEEEPLLDVEELVACSEIIIDYYDAGTCYHKDGTFNPDQWTDISGSNYNDAIRYITESCLVHGPSDTQAVYNPEGLSLNAQAIKVAVRMSQRLDKGFNHYDVSADDRYKPYYEEAENSWNVEALISPYETISLYDLFDLYIQVAEDVTGEDRGIELPASWKQKTVTRGMFAYIIQVFDTMINPVDVDTSMDDDVAYCLSLLETNNNYACQYNDGKFDPSQRSDINGSQYKGSIEFITETCLVHGPQDNQAEYGPYRLSTNAQIAKVAARMGGLLDADFNHFASPVWHAPYYAALQEINSNYSDDFLNNLGGVAHLDDLLRAYLNVINSLDQGIDVNVENMLTLINTDKTITREAFAAITQMFTVQMYK